MTSSRRRRLAFSALLLVTCLPTAASAQRTAQDIASARQLYNEGIELRDKGDMKGALEKFRAAHALGNTPLTGIELCRAYSAVRQPVEARETCLAIGRIAPLPEESQRSKDARTDAARLAEAEKARIGAIRVKITGVPPGSEPTVSVDGAAVPAVALSEPRAVNPGVHAITARVGNGPETRAILETHEGETRDLELAVQPPPAGAAAAPSAPPQSAPAAQPPSREKKNGFATVSFGIAGIAALVGTVGGIVAISGESDLSDKCKNKLCGRDQWEALDSAKTWGTISTAFFVVAGVAVTAGLVSTLASSSSKAAKAKPSLTPVLGLGGAGLHGTF